MTNFGNLPFEKLIAYQEARKLLEAMRESGISEGRLRDQAVRAAISVCLNISEGAGRAGSADKARVYAIARGENCEVAAGWSTPEHMLCYRVSSGGLCEPADETREHCVN